MMVFILFVLFLIGQRLSELYVSARNTRWLLAQGAIEYGRSHYPYMVAMHTAFIVSVIVEYALSGQPPVNVPVLLLFFALLAVKYWVISSLGRYWNTRIYRVPGAVPVRSGVYKYIRHPNYVIVVAEIALIPLSFHLYVTAIVFTLLNAAMLTVRIREENRVWLEGESSR